MLLYYYLLDQQRVPHARTLRNAREQAKCMVADCVSRKKIRNYLAQWSRWWAKTANWKYDALLNQFIDTCWDQTIADIATECLTHHITALHTGRRDLACVQTAV